MARTDCALAELGLMDRRARAALQAAAESRGNLLSAVRLRVVRSGLGGEAGKWRVADGPSICLCMQNSGGACRCAPASHGLNPYRSRSQSGIAC